MKSTTLTQLTLWPEPTVVSIGPKGYTTPDGVFPRVTSVLKAYGGSTDALVKWSANEERKAILEACSEVYAGPDPGGPSEFAAAVEARIGAARQHQRLLTKAADIGTAIHETIQWTLREELKLERGPEPTLPDPALWGFLAWRDWWASEKLTPLRCEQPVWDAELGYAGTVDLIAEGPQGLELLDWKTGKGIYDSYHMQVAAYAHACRNWGVVGRCRIVRLPKVVDDPTMEVKELGDLTYDYTTNGKRVHGGRHLDRNQLLEAFKAALVLYNTLLAKE